MNNLKYSDRHFNTDWQFEIFKEAKTMDMILGKCKFQKSFSYFQLHMLKVHIGIAP